MIGKQIAHYKITAKIGEGGMGEVYRATDTKLNRDVALKILPEQFAADGQRMGRFQREAEVLASLDHPNIGAIHGIEDVGETKALVLQLIEGPTLADRIAKGPIPVDEALPIALQIAEALEAAHEKGIIHRDLKPANVMVTPDGTVKVLDFGLAKAMEPEPSPDDLSRSPTLTMQATQAGIILGTAAYMSPEQARAQPVDKRADIWAFGCVLYEMSAGRQVFEGGDLSMTLASVIKEEPNWERLGRRIPDRIRNLLQRCLVKEPRQRLRDIGDARISLEEVIRDPGEAVTDKTGSRRRTAALIPWAIVAVLSVTLLGLLWGPSGGDKTDAPLSRFVIETPWYSAPNWTDFDAAISADGRHIAYNCREGNSVDICVRPLNSLSAQSLGYDARDMIELFFSPDGEWVGILDRDRLARVSIRGGPAQTISRVEVSRGWGEMRGASWGADGDILVGTSSGLLRVASSGGELTPVIRLEEGSTISGYYEPAFLPGGKKALVVIRHQDESSNAGIVDLTEGRVRQLALRGESFVYSSTGHIVFRQGTTLLAASFDTDSERVGEPIPVLEDVRIGPRLAADGTLVYIPTRGDSNARLLWLDRAGRPTPIAGERRNYSHLDLSPDGSKALLDISAQTYVLDLDRGTRNLLSRGSFPIWHSDGRRAVTADRGLHLQSAEGSEGAEALIETDSPLVPTSWNPTTGDLAYYSHVDFDIWIRPRNGEPFAFLAGPGRTRSGRFSPDGKLLAYVNDETGEYQVYVTAYPGQGPKIAVSIDGGLSPIWSSDGNELFFRRGGKVLAVKVGYENGLSFSVPEELFDGPYTLDLMGHQRYDVSPDGQSFLMVENSDDFPIVVVQNWFEELKRLVPMD